MSTVFDRETQKTGEVVQFWIVKPADDTSIVKKSSLQLIQNDKNTVKKVLLQPVVASLEQMNLHAKVFSASGSKVKVEWKRMDKGFKLKIKKNNTHTK